MWLARQNIRSIRRMGSCQLLLHNRLSFSLNISAIIWEATKIYINEVNLYFPWSFLSIQHSPSGWHQTCNSSSEIQSTIIIHKVCLYVKVAVCLLVLCKSAKLHCLLFFIPIPTTPCCIIYLLVKLKSTQNLIGNQPTHKLKS